MNKTAVFAFLAFFLTSPMLHAAEAVRHFQASGEVRTVDPVYSQVTIEHGVIKGLAHDGVTEFYVTDPAMLKGISTGDLVDFEITDTKGDVKIDRILKTGTAPPREEGIPVGEALQQTFQGVGDIAGAVTAPIPPVSESIGGATRSTVESTDPRIQDGEVKQKLATF
jgi:Cu/Ag efflux protein CusF